MLTHVIPDPMHAFQLFLTEGTQIQCPQSLSHLAHILRATQADVNRRIRKHKLVAITRRKWLFAWGHVLGLQ